jgi:hypothetical protein
MAASEVAFALRDINKDTQEVERQVLAPPEPAAVIIKPTFEYTAEELRDPFEGIKEQGDEAAGRQDVPASPLPPLIVKGVVWGSETSQAIINDQVVRPGDTIGEVRIISIDKEGVKVLHQGCPYELSAPAGALFKRIEEKTGGNDEK